MWVKLALKLFMRELKRGELTIISAAIALAVLTVFTLSAVTDRIRLNIEQKSTEFIAADRRLDSNHAIDSAFLNEAQQRGLQTAELTYFDTMLFANDDMLLVSVKAATESYPLRGKVIIKNTLDGDTFEVSSGPKKGEVWLSESIFYSMKLQVGDEVEIGAGRFAVSHVLVREPDGALFSFTGNRRIIINQDDIAATKVIQPGSRVFYRFLFAGDETTLSDYYSWLKPQLKDNQTWEGIKDRQSPLGDNLTRSSQFLLIAGLLGIILAAVAMAVSAKRYCERQYDPVAMMKTLGGSRSTIRKMYLLHLSLICFFSISLGLLIGFGLQTLGADYLAQSMGTTLPNAGWKPWFMAIFIGAVCAVMFALKPLLDLFDIPPLRVLRRNLGDTLAIGRMHMAMSALTVFGLMWLFSGNLKVSVILYGASALVVAVLFGISRLIFGGGRRLGLSPANSWSLALATIQKRANANAVQLISFALAIKLMLLLVVLKNDMIADWQAQVPQNAPNAFLINIAKDEVAPISAYFEQHGIEASEFYPVIRGRVQALNNEKYARDVSLQEGEKKDEEAKQGVGRELNLTWAQEMPATNDLVEGEWFNNDGSAQVSVEQGMAEGLKIKLGDELTLLINNQEVSARVTSFRKVDWGSMQPNFFMILNPEALAHFPATYFTASHVSSEQNKVFNQLLMQYPTISVVDIQDRLLQAQSIINQVSLAIGFVLAIVVLCGTLVLISQVQASLAERMQEIVILRTLGARGSLIKQATLYEFLLLGLIAGLVAAIVSDVTLLIIQQQVFELPGKLHPKIWLFGPLSGGVFVALVGYSMVAKTMRQNTQGLLRALS
ncbi:ABC transporter permease [Pseudoalteromonas tunicata]|uniref:ABC transporter permease n=1 Tax=Pseudoalteromonas tunicata TaxID=314281 RepID=UPI00273D3F44|nr:FtsX-like permease family protein [Pseudoalteromonas tunicata]MDP4982087.1 FtsX-like permease family protein [Pseudoalteromonas tunicata]MDP5211498.1 FtsX-like permease family protein [Pseudoalteromonas tunicata]